MNGKYFILFLVFFVFGSGAFVFADSQRVYRFEIRDQIDPAAWRTVRSALAEANEQKADVLFLVLNTYGGQVDMADSIRSALLQAKQKTIVFIDHNAASAGALIAIACDRILMQKGASIGAASVVNQSGEIMPEKYQSYMRSLMRATAEVKKRNPQIAEGFVDPELEIEGIKPQGKVLTFTTSEAIKYGFCDGEYTSEEQALRAELGEGYELMVQHLSLTDRIIGFLINPAVSGILILLIVGGIYFELQTPGVGLALIVAILAAVLYFAPLYLEGLAANWEILLFVTGILLIMLELFVIPGFGITGVLGIISMISGLAFSLVMNDYFNFSSTSSQSVLNAFMLVIGSLVAAIVLSIVFGKNLLKSSLFQRLVLNDEQQAGQGYVSTSVQTDLRGATGLALTDLRPSGKIEINGVRYDALSEDGYIQAGEQVIVTRNETTSLFVRRYKVE